MPVAQSALAMADETSAWPLSAITDLSERIAACESRAGHSQGICFSTILRRMLRMDEHIAPYVLGIPYFNHIG